MKLEHDQVYPEHMHVLFKRDMVIHIFRRRIDAEVYMRHVCADSDALYRIEKHTVVERVTP